MKKLAVNKQTDRRTDATKRIISLCFAVDNKSVYVVQNLDLVPRKNLG